MPAVPKKKSTRARTGKRRGKFAILLPNLVSCPSCKKLKMPHVTCPGCGWHHANS